MNVRIQKLNLVGEVKYEYGGTVLEKDQHQIVVEAFFDREDMPFQDVVLKKGDRFLEFYYFHRWYNIFEIYDRDDGKFKGWYCNIGMPAIIDDDVISYVDLALDLWVAVNGEQTVLDEDEFENLNLGDKIREDALSGFKELQFLFESKKPSQSL